MKRNRFIFEDGFYKDYEYEPSKEEWKELLEAHKKCVKIQALGFEPANEWLVTQKLYFTPNRREVAV